MGLISSLVGGIILLRQRWWRRTSGIYTHGEKYISSIRLPFEKEPITCFGYADQVSHIYGLGVLTAPREIVIIRLIGFLKSIRRQEENVIARLIPFFSPTFFFLFVLRPNTKDVVFFSRSYSLIPFLFLSCFLSFSSWCSHSHSTSCRQRRRCRIFWKSSTPERGNWSTLENPISRPCMVSYSIRNYVIFLFFSLKKYCVSVLPLLSRTRRASSSTNV